MTTTTAKTLYLTSFDGFIEFCRKGGNQAAQAQIDALERKANDLPVEWFDSLTGEITKYKHSGRMDVDAGREIAKIIMAAGK